MRVRRRVLLWAVLMAPLLGCSGGSPSPAGTAEAPAAGTTDAPAADALQPWIAKRTVEWEKRPWEKAEVGAVWLLRHGGQDALLVDVPRGHRDTLMRPDGLVICEPDGFGSNGNGRCPTVVDAGTTPRLLWAHPGNPSPNFGPPPLWAQTTPAASVRPPRPPRPPLPGWLEHQIRIWERQDVRNADALSVVRLQHRGATAYLIDGGCCKTFKTLYDAYGRELCMPSGGFTGDGDGRCPNPGDPGTQRVGVWTHPDTPPR